MEIVRLDNDYHKEVTDFIDNEWGTPIITKGNIIDIFSLPGFAAVDNGKLAGAILYQVKDNECEIAAFFSLTKNKGIGSKLINAVIDAAKEHDCARVWLITTNDNTQAIRYYQKRGFTLKAAHINAFKITQRLKGEFGKCNGGKDGLVLGIDDIPILHELEFEVVL
ncbi:MAG: GNAT family N-acetyltransferase [Defluviitaleaceae bacterium]|nr:GNAT family N-acetyltransferase [Defluviitaleaceae bacterium]MCL2835899.1 GNAT family N-acetyltransferase [Defluviitaleaceae bacterium]